MGGPKLVGIDLATNKVVKTIVFPSNVAYPDSVSTAEPGSRNRRRERFSRPFVANGFQKYLNDLRSDLRKDLSSTSGQGVAYITDSSSTSVSGLITVDLGSGSSWRHLTGDPRTRGTQQHLRFIWGEPVYGSMGAEQPFQYDSTGADGIALSADGSTVYWSVTASRYLYSIPSERLRDESKASEVKNPSIRTITRRKRRIQRHRRRLPTT